MLARRDEVIHHLDDSKQLPWLEEHNVTLVRGRGRIAGKLQVDVEGQDSLSARQAVVVATGSTALVPDIPGLRDSKPWTSRNATTAQATCRPGSRSSAAASSQSRWPRPGEPSARR